MAKDYDKEIDALWAAVEEIRERLEEQDQELIRTVPVKIKPKRMPEDHVPKPFHGNPVP